MFAATRLLNVPRIEHVYSSEQTDRQRRPPSWSDRLFARCRWMSDATEWVGDRRVVVSLWRTAEGSICEVYRPIAMGSHLGLAGRQVASVTRCSACSCRTLFYRAVVAKSKRAVLSVAGTASSATETSSTATPITSAASTTTVSTTPSSTTTQLASKPPRTSRQCTTAVDLD